MDDEQRAQSDKSPICVDPDDPNEQDDDCPIIYNMGGNSEMVLNRGVGPNVDLNQEGLLSSVSVRSSTGQGKASNNKWEPDGSAQQTSGKTKYYRTTFPPWERIKLGRRTFDFHL